MLSKNIHWEFSITNSFSIFSKFYCHHAIVPSSGLYSQREQASQIASEGASQSVSEPASILADCFSVFQFAVLWKNDDWETFKLMEAKTFKKHDGLRTQGGWTETHSPFFWPFSLLYTQNIYTLIPVNFLKPQPSSTAFHDTLQYQPLSQSPSLS